MAGMAVEPFTQSAKNWDESDVSVHIQSFKGLSYNTSTLLNYMTRYRALKINQIDTKCNFQIISFIMGKVM